jgi:hypothetical protein
VPSDAKDSSDCAMMETHLFVEVGFGFHDSQPHRSAFRGPAMYIWILHGNQFFVTKKIS